MKLLGIDTNAKTRKGQKRGYMTGISYLAPSNASGVMNTCPSASKGCRAACLFTSGRGRMNMVMEARINKTKLFASDSESYLKQLKREIEALVKRTIKIGKIACVRLNGTSDIAWEEYLLDGKSIFDHFPDTQFYDYTKRLSRIADYANGKFSKNYHLTFSMSENTGEATVKDILNRGVNVAVVYKDALPKEDFGGVDVLNGDEDDLRFLDVVGKIVGLIYKRSAASEDEWNGFVRETKAVSC
jgi:hypothetical protein